MVEPVNVCPCAMSEALRESLPLAVVIAVFPVPIIGVVLLLTTPRARLTGPMFVLGWTVGLGSVTTLFLVLADASDANTSTGPATWVSALNLAIALVLLGTAAYKFRARPRTGDPPAMPRWMSRIESMRPGAACGLGVALAGANPKNILLAAAGAAAIADTGIAGTHQAVTLVVFVLVGTCGVALPVVMSFTMGSRSASVLGRLKDALQRHMAVMVSVLCVLIAAKLIWNALSALA